MSILMLAVRVFAALTLGMVVYAAYAESGASVLGGWEQYAKPIIMTAAVLMVAAYPWPREE
jgi:hypothetical protein